MRKCKYVKQENLLKYGSFNDTYNSNETYYYQYLYNLYAIYSNDKNNMLYYCGSFNITYFHDLFIDIQKERKLKLKKLYEKM